MTFEAVMDFHTYTTMHEKKALAVRRQDTSRRYTALRKRLQEG